MAATASITVPAAAREALARDGFCIVEDVLPAEDLTRYREALYRVARFDRESGWLQHYAYDAGANANQRIWNLISRDPLFCRLVEHPLALAFLRETIGWPALLSGSSANIVNRHGDEEVLHADQTYIPSRGRGRTASTSPGASTPSPPPTVPPASRRAAICSIARTSPAKRCLRWWPWRLRRERWW